ncbi:hypothetical protein B0A49_03555 [Cryomyces minteri]|uniref:NAD-dependent epimerase/dehydratase domain-containing protein n=1 Tax=Cryomyces minteri TaxID=331657 RepID=A0A4U0XW29_9PEZI|nr:hypothetical protein B0A49_03555 [Cryomyces minteri]
MPSAIVTSATGILGREINVVHKHIDLTSSAEEMAEQPKNVEGEYMFFAAYLAKDSEKEAANVNGAMLKNFLEALKVKGADKKIKRVVLTTAGAKQYGLEILADAAKNSASGWDWVVTYPNDVIGVAKGNFMNLATSIGLYCAVSKELGNGDLVFSGSETFYTKSDCFTYSRLHASFNTWAALGPKASNQAFNVVNGDVESWQNLFPKLARKFGTTMAERPPLADFAGERGLQDNKVLKQSAVEQRIDLMKWGQRDDVKAAWKKLAEREGLEHDAFEKATWGFLGFVLGRNFDLVISMSKARKAGWTGYVDSWDALSECSDELANEKVLPKFK